MVQNSIASMKNFRHLITSLFCIYFVSVFVLFNVVNLENNNKIFGIELESELESEAENEIKLKSKNHQYLEENLNFSFDFVGDYLFALAYESKSHKNHILEVPTSPPNNC